MYFRLHCAKNDFHSKGAAKTLSNESLTCAMLPVNRINDKTDLRQEVYRQSGFVLILITIIIMIIIIVIIIIIIIIIMMMMMMMMRMMMMMMKRMIFYQFLNH